MSSTVIVITDASLKLADTEAGLTAAPDFQCQVTEAAINATPNLQTVPATFCGPETQVPAATGYELALTWLQDWTTGTGLSFYAYDNDTLEKHFSLSLKGSDEPIAKGLVRIVAGSFGGPAGTPLTAQATWPVQGKPTIGKPTAPTVVSNPVVTNPVVGPSKGAAAPGDTFTAEATVTASDATNAAKLAGLGFVAAPTTAWTATQKITVGTFDFHWDGSAWADGAAT